jgi:hypothetical protein
MKEPLKRYFNFSDGQTHDASVTETSDALASCQNYKWSVTPNAQGITGASPDYTIEVSNDGIAWFEYNNLSSNVDVEDAVDDNHLTFTMMRIVHDGTGTSGGTVQYLFTQKRG